MDQIKYMVLIRQLEGYEPVATAVVSWNDAERYKNDYSTNYDFDHKSWMQAQLEGMREDFENKFTEFRKATWTYSEVL